MFVWHIEEYVQYDWLSEDVWVPQKVPEALGIEGPLISPFHGIP